MVKNWHPWKCRSYRGTLPEFLELSWDASENSGVVAARPQKSGELSPGQSYCFDVAVLLRGARSCPRKSQSYCVAPPRLIAGRPRKSKSCRGAPQEFPALPRDAPRIPGVIAERPRKCGSCRRTPPKSRELSRGAPRNPEVIAGRPKKFKSMNDVAPLLCEYPEI